MAEFIAKIKAELGNIKDVEQKLENLTKEKKIKIDVDDSKIDEAAKKAEKLDNKKVQVDTKVTGDKDVEKLSENLNTATKRVNGFNNSVKSGFSKLGAYFNVFKLVQQGAKKAVEAIEDIDKSIVDLQMATGDNYDNVKQLMSGYNDFAKQLGATTTEVSAGASDWLRQGKSISETNKLIQDSMVLSKVANISSEDSTSYLTAMMKGYKKAADEVSEINDSLTSIDLAAAVDAGGLAEATSRVAASADLAGISLNRLLGYEAAVGEASQESMSVIGNSFKTIFSRMSDIKAGKLELVDEDGTTETLSDVETVLNNIGIQLRDSANEFRDYDEVLDDTAKRWSNLSSVQQAAVSKAFAGQRQANRFKLLMENYDTALKYEKIANESSGTAMQKFNDGYLNSIEAKQKSLQASFEGLSTNLISRDTISGILEATQALVEFLDTTNLLKGALAGVATGGMLKGFVALTTSITQAAMKMQEFQHVLEFSKTKNMGVDDIQKLSMLVEGFSKNQVKAVASSKQLTDSQKIFVQNASSMTEAQKKTVLSAMEVSEKQAMATLSTMGLAAAEGTATTSTLSLGAALKGMLSTLVANPIVLISAALTAGVTAWNYFSQSAQESIQRATESTTAWNESNNSLNEQIAKYKELKQQLDSGSLTPTEEYDTRKEILDIQNQITTQYGTQASNIDLVNGSLQTQLGLLHQISSENAKQTLNENREEYKNAKEQMTKERKYVLGNTRIDNDNLRKDIEDIAESFEKEGIHLEETGDGSGVKTIFFDGDASQADKAINDLMNKVEELKSKYTDEDSINILDYILNQSAESLTNNKEEILDKHEESYKKFLQMDMLSQGTGKGSVADTFNKYTEAVEKYNDALASGDTDTINKTRSDFSELSKEVDTLLSKDGNSQFKVLFDDVTDQLNTAGIKMMDFQEVVTGKSNSNNQFHNLSDDIRHASDSLKYLKLDAVDAMDALMTGGKQTGEDELWTLAKAWGLTAESSKEEIQEFVDALSQTGLVSGVVEDSLGNASKAFESFSTSVKETISNYETLKSVMSESVSGAGISADNVSAFRAMFGDDADKVLEETANGYHLNKKALAELQSQMGAMTKTDYLSALNEQYTELRDIEAQIATAELLGRDTSGLEASRNGILNNITSLQDLQVQYEAATSAYQQWQSAMSGGEEGDMYDSIYGNIDKAKELYDKGLTGTNAFREFADLMSPDDLSNASNEEIVAAYEKALPFIKRYFTEGQEGAQNFLKDIEGINSEWAHMNEDGSWDIDFGFGNDQEVADALGIDVEAVQAIMRKLSDYGFDINLDRPVASMKELKKQAESADKSLSKMGDDLQIELDVDSLKGVDKQISSVEEYIDGIENSDLELDVKTDKLNAANSILEYLITRKQELGEKENVDVSLNIDEAALQEGYGLLNRLKNDLQNLDGKVGVDTTGLQTDINNCVAEIEAMSPEMKVALGIQGLTSDEIKAGLLDGTIQLPVDAETEEANNKVDELSNKKIEDKNFSVNANTSQAENSLATIRNYLSAITNKTVTVTVNKKTTNESTHSGGKGGSPAGSVSLNGTAHAQGTAFANGNWGNPVAGKKLVGELGTEIIVNPHTGRWYTVGDNGAEFTEVPKDAIVFNHLQSESLLKKGYVNGRGNSLSNGTALVGGTALSGGTGAFNTGNSGSSANSSSSNTNNNNYNNNDKSDDKTKEKTKQTFDWIERLLERLQQKIDLTKAKFENIFTLKKQKSNLKTQIDQTKALLTANTKAAKAYKKYANKVGLSSSLKKKVQSGAYNIKDYGEETAEKINKYKEYYDKYKEAQKQVQELTTEIRELKEQRYQLVVDKAEDKIDMNEAKASISTDYKKTNKYADEQIRLTKKSYNYQIKIAKLTKDTVKVKQLEAEREKEIIELQKQKFDTIETYYENQISLLQAKENAIQDQADVLEAKGMTLNANVYSDQIYYEKEKQKQLQKSKQELEAQLKNITEGTEEWYECKSAIADVASEISNCNKSIAEMNSSMTGLADNFHDKMMKTGKTIIDTMDWAANLMDNVDMFDSETGGITNEGLATLGSYVSNYNTSSGMSDMYRKLVENLESNYNSGTLSFIDSNGLRRSYNSLEEFKAAIDDTYESWRDQISTTYDYESKIIDMMRDKLENELSALRELIDAKKEALQREKDLHDYQQSIQEKTKDISTIQKQIAAYKGDTSEEAYAQLQKLQVQLNDAEKDLRETEYDKYISDQEEMLDKLYEEYEKSMTAELQNVQKLLQDGIEIAKKNSEMIEGIFESYTNKYDYNGRFDSMDDGIDHITNDSKTEVAETLKDNANEGVAPGTNETTVSKTIVAELAQQMADKIASVSSTISDKVTVNKISGTITNEKPSSKTTTQGDGKAQVGDKVKFEKGKYYASSDGTGASGNQKLGKKVYIAKIAKNAKYPYCISTSKDIKDGLGWVKKSQLSGFKTGGIARLLKSKGEDGLAMVRNGEGLIPPENVSQIEDLLKAVPIVNDALQQPLVDTNTMPKLIPIPTTPPSAEMVFNIDMNHVTNPEEFVYALQTNKKVQKAVQAVTVDRMAGGSRLAVNQIRC